MTGSWKCGDGRRERGAVPPEVRRRDDFDGEEEYDGTEMGAFEPARECDMDGGDGLHCRSLMGLEEDERVLGVSRFAGRRGCLAGCQPSVDEAANDLRLLKAGIHWVSYGQQYSSE